MLADLELERVALVGSSMGAATAMAFALRHPERTAALVQITPAYNGAARTGNVEDGAWDAMADGLESGGVDAFVDVAQPADAAEELEADRARGGAPAHGAPRAPARGRQGAAPDSALGRLGRPGGAPARRRYPS